MCIFILTLKFKQETLFHVSFCWRIWNIMHILHVDDLIWSNKSTEIKCILFFMQKYHFFFQIYFVSSSSKLYFISWHIWCVFLFTCLQCKRNAIKKVTNKNNFSKYVSNYDLKFVKINALLAKNRHHMNKIHTKTSN